MQFRILALLVLLFFKMNYGNAQEDKSFQYDSFSIQPFGLYIGQNNFEGYALRGDINFRAGQKRISLALNSGAEIDILGGRTSDYVSISGLYGYSFKPIPNVEFDLQAGLGVIRFNIDEGDFLSGLDTFFVFAPKSSDPSDIDKLGKFIVGFPIQAKLRFPTGPRFSLGIQAGYNINSVSNTFHWGIVLQWNKRR